MRVHHWMSHRVGKGIVIVLGLAVSLALLAVVRHGVSSRAEAQTQPAMEATIFAYDGHDFVRTRTTLMTEDGASAVNTKLDRGTPAYKALLKKRSYVGDAVVFGRKYEADYAPLTGDDGRLTGALFVAVAR